MTLDIKERFSSSFKRKLEFKTLLIAFSATTVLGTATLGESCI